MAYEKKGYGQDNKNTNRGGYQRGMNEKDGERSNKPYPRYQDGERSNKPYPRYQDGERSNKPYPRYQDGERSGKPYPRYQDGERSNKPYPRYQDGERSNKPYPRYQDGERSNKPYPRYQDGERSGKPYPRYQDGERSNKPYPRYQDGERLRYEREAEPQPSSIKPADELPNLIYGRNAVREAVKGGRSIDRIWVVKEPDGSLREIIRLARDNQIRVEETSKFKLDELCMPFGHGVKPGNHQGIVAQVPGIEYCELSDILDYARDRGEHPFVLLLDGMEDPHNMGSIIRSAECAGVHGVIISKRRNVGVTAAVVKASAGAVAHMRVARVPNLSMALEQLKQGGIWLAGADMDGEPMSKIDLKGPLALVIGGEGGGLSRLTREKCDYLAAIPMYGQVGSLNASVAAAVLMYEKKRQDGEN